LNVFKNYDYIRKPLIWKFCELTSKWIIQVE
jgi:hypothetical protein